MTTAEEARKVDLLRADVWDYETTGLYWWRDDAYALAALVDDQPYVFVGEALHVAQCELLWAFETEERPVIAYNAKFEMHFTRSEPMTVRAKVIDPSVALFLVDENRFSGSGHGLKHAVKSIFGYEMTDFNKMLGHVTEETGDFKVRKCKACAGKGWRGRDHSQCEPCAGVGKEARPVTRRRKRHISEVPLTELARYAGEDVWWTKRVWEWVQAKLAANTVLEQNFYEVQMPLLVALYDGEHHGVRVDKSKAIDLRQRYEDELAALDAELARKLGMNVEGGYENDDGDGEGVPWGAD